jgi:hypothetical protein
VGAGGRLCKKQYLKTIILYLLILSIFCFPNSELYISILGYVVVLREVFTRLVITYKFTNLASKKVIRFAQFMHIVMV